MEDIQGARRPTVNALRKHDWGVKTVFTAMSTRKLAEEQGFGFFILDIDMGQRGDQLGLEALRLLKAYSEEICVVILSNHTKEYRDRALRGGAAAVIPKTGDTEKDVRQVLDHFYRHLGRMAQMRSDRLEVSRAPVLSQGIDDLQLDPNEAEFQRLSADPRWVKKFSGMYAGFADASLVDVFETREACVSALVVGYANQPRFIARIGAPATEFEIPGIFEIEFH